MQVIRRARLITIITIRLKCASPSSAVEAAVIDGFADMLRAYVFGTVKVGYCTGNLEYPVVSTGRHIVFLHGPLENSHSLGCERTIASLQFRCDLRVAVNAGFTGIAASLYLTGTHYPLPYVRRWLTRSALGQFIEWHGHDFNMYINAVKQGARYAAHISGYRPGSTCAFFSRMRIISARTRVHGCHKHKAGRIINLITRT